LLSSVLVVVLLHLRRPRSTLFPYTTLFRSQAALPRGDAQGDAGQRQGVLRHRVVGAEGGAGGRQVPGRLGEVPAVQGEVGEAHQDRKSTRLNSSHVKISYAVFCLKKKTVKN